ncbi:restriction endonuclease subunit S [Streptococcus thermophilus]|uniref:restriction endonuclease subunit S n=1 Tax=Streptococcus thermophilus TaxID=1308 RepID=UPI003A811DFB
MTNSKHVPKRRFSGFEEAWYLIALEEIAKITMGQSPNGETYSDTPNDYILVQGNADLVEGWVKPRLWTTQVTKRADKGDIIMSVRAPAGEVGRTNYDVVIGRGVAAIKGNDFIFQRLIKMNLDGYWKSLSAGSTFESLNSDDIKRAIFKIPSIHEQEYIGRFFETLDSFISLHQHKLDKLKDLKKAYLSEMFPAEGERVPKRRFPGFEGEWEEKKLGEMSNITAGGDVDKDKLLTKGNYPVLANAHTNEGIIGYYEENYQIEAPAVTVTGRGDIGFAKARKENFTPVVRLLSIKSKHNVDFLAEAINQNKVIFESTGVPQLTIPKLSNYKIYFPTEVDEENSIGNFLVSLDSLITLQQQKLDKLNDLKKAYLNELFV